MLCTFQNLLSMTFYNPDLNYAVLRSGVLQKHFPSSQIGIHINKGCRAPGRSKWPNASTFCEMHPSTAVVWLSVAHFRTFCIAVSHFMLAQSRISFPSPSLPATKCLWAVPNLGISLQICHCLYDRR